MTQICSLPCKVLCCLAKTTWIWGKYPISQEANCQNFEKDFWGFENVNNRLGRLFLKELGHFVCVVWACKSIL